LLETLEHGNDIANVKGIAFSKYGSLLLTEERERLNPSGLRPMRVSDFYKIYDASLYYPAPSIRRFVPMIASRGCTQRCDSCDSEKVWRGRIEYRTPTDIISEIEELYIDENDIFMFDEDNLFLNQQILGSILNQLAKKSYNLASQGDIRFANPELLRMLKQAGWTSILWGVESIDPCTSTREKPGSTPEKVYSILNETEKLGIFNHAMTMIGFEYETEESILKYAAKLPDYPIHQLRSCIATPFPGTRFYQRLEQQGHSFDSDLSKWDTGHLVYDHPTILPERMRELQHQIVTGFYKSPQWDKRMNNMARQFPHLRQSIDEFRDYTFLRL